MSLMFSDIHERKKRIQPSVSDGFRRRCLGYEDDISAEEEIQSQGSRIPGKNEHKGRQKSTGSQKIKRKKKIISIKTADMWSFLL